MNDSEADAPPSQRHQFFSNTRPVTAPTMRSGGDRTEGRTGWCCLSVNGGCTYRAYERSVEQLSVLILVRNLVPTLLRKTRSHCRQQQIGREGFSEDGIIQTSGPDARQGEGSHDHDRNGL